MSALRDPAPDLVALDAEFRKNSAGPAPGGTLTIYRSRVTGEVIIGVVGEDGKYQAMTLDDSCLLRAASALRSLL